MLAGLQIGIVAGFMIGGSIVVLTSDTTFAEFFAKMSGTDMADIAVAVLCGVLALLLAVVVLVPIHELGHLVCGRLSGYRFVSFRIFNFTFIKENGRLKVKKFAVAGTGGQCLLSPPDMPDDRIPTFWYNAGGVAANILVLLLSLPLMFSGNPYVKEAALIFILTDAVLILMNGIPLPGICNDAYNALMLGRKPEAKRGMLLQLRANALIQNGVRPKDMPPEWFIVPENMDYKNALEVSIPLMAASRLVDMGDYDAATEMFEELYSHRDSIMQLYVREIACELVFLYLVRGQKARAEALLGKDLRKYIETYRKVMSSKERIYCAIKYYIDNEPAKAEEIYRQLCDRESDYLLGGEVKSDLALLSDMFARN